MREIEPDSTDQNEVNANFGSLPAWLDTVAISRHRPDGQPHGVWDSDGRVQDKMVGTDGDWILVRPDGYVSARGNADTSLSGIVDRIPGLCLRDSTSM